MKGRATWQTIVFDQRPLPPSTLLSLTDDASKVLSVVSRGIAMALYGLCCARVNVCA